MKKQITAFALGAIFALSVLHSMDLIAASGDIIYETSPGDVCITNTRALCYANCAKTDNAWTGVVGDMESVLVQRQQGCSTGKNFVVTATGLTSAPAGSVPDGSVFRGVVE